MSKADSIVETGVNSGTNCMCSLSWDESFTAWKRPLLLIEIIDRFIHFKSNHCSKAGGGSSLKGQDVLLQHRRG